MSELEDLYKKHLLDLPDDARVRVIEKKKGALRAFEKNYSVHLLKKEYEQAIMKFLEEHESGARSLVFINSIRTVRIKI